MNRTVEGLISTVCTRYEHVKLKVLSGNENDRLHKEWNELLEYADYCGEKRWDDQKCGNRVTGWRFDFSHIAIALTTIGMNPNDDLIPSEYQLSNFPDPKGE